MALRGAQDILIDCLKIMGVEKQVMTNIVLAVQKPKQLDAMLSFIAKNRKASQEELLEKAMEIHNSI